MKLYSNLAGRVMKGINLADSQLLRMKSHNFMTNQAGHPSGEHHTVAQIVQIIVRVRKS